MGKRTLGVCDRCGLEYLLNSLKFQVIARQVTKLRVCKGCMDKDQPQWFSARTAFGDPKPIPDARPDQSSDIGNGGWGWNPVGGPGTTMILGLTYSFALEDNLVEVSEDDSFFLLESGYRMLQEDGAFLVPVEQ